LLKRVRVRLSVGDTADCQPALQNLDELAGLPYWI